MFTSAEILARKYLRHLGKDTSDYQKYFKWYKIGDSDAWMCIICDKLCYTDCCYSSTSDGPKICDDCDPEDSTQTNQSV